MTQRSLISDITSIEDKSARERSTALHNPWFVEVAKPAAEATAAAHLVNQDFDVFIPQYRKVVRHSRRTYERLAPFFPGYLFVSFDPERTRWRAINGTYGVRYLITQNEWPVPLPNGFVQALIERAQPDGAITLGYAFEPGDKVKFVTGPFAHLTGELVSVDDRGRVAVLLGLLSGSVPVHTSSGNLLPSN